MKRLLFCICAIMTVVIAMAEDVTPAEALKQATQFVQNRIASGQHSRRAAGTPAQLTQTAKVSGLYVFNVDNSGGFVIVSNDDRTEPVLGYSDSGSFDPANIPDNMRAWLQGYADEIAWLNEHPRPAAIKAPSRTSDATIKTPIAPLVQTTWDQGEPYNNLCPYYYEDDYGNISYSVEQVNDDYEHCATGCVATAMAQVMKYHKWPEQATKNIPSYSWQGNDMTMLTPVAFDWNDMLLNYGNDYTDDEATAVATLMKHCGYSLKMDYGPESGAQTPNVANALKTYFDYNNTTQSIERNYCSYENWINLIYNELQQRRPVVYAGQSSGGGHAFVCDGYQGEDYFHINWGWGGSSDDYFKLSVLNPYDQGIGGSSSNDGFHYSQKAIVGIQKPSDTGTVLNVPETNFNLTLNSIEIDKGSIALGESVIITMNITNNANEDYDADIFLADLNSYSVIAGWDYHISAGETKDCVFNYTPTSKGDYLITPVDGKLYWIDYQKTVSLTVTAGGGSSTTDNITLVRSLTIENCEGNIFYGSILKGELTITNPSSSYSYRGAYHFDIYDNNYNLQWRFLSVITIPANGSMTIPFEMEGANVNSQYIFAIEYIMNNAWTDWDVQGWYTCQPGITAYHADGTKSVTGVSSNYAASEGTLAVDLTGTGVTNVTSSEPNCLFIIGSSDSAPSGANNIIVKNSNGYSATNITLTDNKDFYSPVDFTADNVEFNYNFTVAANGTNGWNTLMLPFNVTKVTATDPTTNETKEIDWFHDADNTGKNFWVKEFTSDANNTVNFYFAEEMKANTPYIVAFPGNKWGNKWDMSNKVLKFIGESVTVSKGGTVSSITGSNYRFIGNTVQDGTEDIYSLNPEGNSFVLNENSGSAPFRAYFKPGIYDRTVNSLAIGSEPNGTTGIEDVNLNVNGNDNVDGKFFNLNGQRVTHPTKGLYINNGKKIIIK